jgi:hypothetical protein
LTEDMPLKFLSIVVFHNKIEKILAGFDLEKISTDRQESTQTGVT